MIITFDLGTTRLKVAAFDLDGKLLGQIAIRNCDEHEGCYRWQKAEIWWQNCIDATSDLVKTENLDMTTLKGISLSGRAGACVFLSGDGTVLADPWSDNRHQTQLRHLMKKNGQNKPAPYAATMVSKFIWMQENQPELAAKTKHLLFAKDFLLYKLTGNFVTDAASGPDNKDWPTIDTHLDESLLPACQLPWTFAGSTTTKAAAELNLASGIPVCVGAHDGICANTGAGAIEEKQFAITLGTHAVVRGISHHHPEDSLRFYGYPPDKHVIGGNALMAGRSLDWFADNWFSAAETERQTLFKQLDGVCQKAKPGSRGITFLPYLAGQLAPEKRPTASATFHGLTLRHNREDMFQAVQEGASFALARVFQQVVRWIGEPQSIGMTGSGILSHSWTQTIANILQRPLDITDASSEGRGAAMFCAVALGYYRDIGDAADGMININRRVIPNGSLAEIYKQLLDEWTAFSRSTYAQDS